MATQRGLAVVSLTVFVDQLGFGIVLPFLPLYAGKLGASAFEVGLLLAIYSLMQMLTATAWGRLSDRIGRKPVLVASAVGAAIGFVILGAAGSLAVVFVGRGLLGSFGVSMSTAQAWVADTTPDANDRARSLAVLSGVGALGFVLGPAIGAIGIITGGMRLPFFLSAGFAAANTALAMIVLPKPPPIPRAAASRRGWREIVPCLAIAFVLTYAFSNTEATFALYTHAELELGASDNGWLFGAIGAIAVATQLVATRWLVGKLSESRRVALGLVTLAAGSVAMPHAWSIASLLVPLAFIAIGVSITTPSLTAWISRRSPPDRQGELLGLAQSTSALARVGGPGVGGLLFDHVSHAAPFQIAGGVIACAAVIALWTKP